MKLIKEYWYLFAVGILLLGALSSWSYAYYQLLRWVVCVAAAYTAFSAFNKNLSGLGWVMVAIAILFNPIVPIILAKSTWAVLDLMAAGVFFVSANFLKNHHGKLHPEA